MEASIRRLSAELEQNGFRQVWFPGEESAVEQAVRDWESAGYEVRRLPLDEERFARNLDSGPYARQRTPVFVRKMGRSQL